MNDTNNFGANLAMNALSEIPNPTANAKQIVALVKNSGRVVGYQLSDGSVLSKEAGVALAKQGGIVGVGIAKRGDTEYLKALPDQSENNNLDSLPSISGWRNKNTCPVLNQPTGQVFFIVLFRCSLNDCGIAPE